MFALQLIDLAFSLYFVLLFLRILASWIPELMDYRWMHWVSASTDPYLNFFRGLIPPFGIIDISPLFAFLALGFLQNVLQIFLKWFVFQLL